MPIHAYSELPAHWLFALDQEAKVTRNELHRNKEMHIKIAYLLKIL